MLTVSFFLHPGEQVGNRQVMVNKSIPTVTNPSLASESHTHSCKRDRDGERQAGRGREGGGGAGIHVHSDRQTDRQTGRYF